MSMTVRKAPYAEITKIVCPECGERVRGVGLLKNSKIEGLTFRCKRCLQISHHLR